MDLGFNYLQVYINLLKKRKLKLMHTAVNLDSGSGSISGVSALRVMAGGMLAWREMEAEA